jgi:hypothetical protein
MEVRKSGVPSEEFESCFPVGEELISPTLYGILFFSTVNAQISFEKIVFETQS